MTLTARIQLRPTPLQKSALERTLAQGNAACNALSALAFSHQTFNQFALHRLAYRAIREQFCLSSQFTIRCIAKVADAYSTQMAQIRRDNAHGPDDQRRTLHQIVCRANGSIAFDARILSFRTDRHTVSIWTVDGRQTIGYVAGEHHDRLLEYQKGESDLVCTNGQWFLLAACEIPDEPPIAITDALGVDLGIVNIATDSDGQTFSGSDVERVRQRYAHRRAVLQSVGTRSAKRRLRKISGRHKHFQRNTNHIIAKTLVEKAKASH